MMRKFLLLGLILTPSAYAQEALEEAIILNQELEFLENSARAISPGLDTAEVNTGRSPDLGESLERTYFKDEEIDQVRTRTAAPKRRGF